jgi:hyperosmotically inducible protein
VEGTVGAVRQQFAPQAYPWDTGRCLSCAASDPSGFALRGRYKEKAMNRHPLLSTTAVALAALSLALGACTKRDEADRTAGERVDSAVATTEQKAGEAKEAMKDGAQTAGNEVRKAAEATGDAVKDAAITAAVNAELARDPSLSAIRINVDTSNGHVQLKGDAPSSDARERATQLASNVKGVVTVDNQLTVATSKS